MQRPCAKCGSSFVIHPDEEAFLRKMTFTFGKKEIHPPLPVYCPECRLRHRTCHRNERNFYRRTSSLSGKEFISVYHQEPLWGPPYKVWTHDEWNAESVDFISEGRPFDFSRPFFEQFGRLHKDVPRLGSMVIGNENSDFTAGTGYCKSCYIINSSEYCEDCYYGKLLQSCKDSVDCSYLYDSELCYDCFSVYKSYHCVFVSFSTNCRDCFFSANLTGCSNCCLCANLHQKQYHFRNEPLPKAEYERRMQEFLGSFAGMEEMKTQLEDLRRTIVRKFANMVNNENCTGDYIENSRNCLDCYDVNESEDSRYVTVGVKVKDNYDCSNMYIKPELAYETLGTIETYNTAYCLFVFHSQNMLLCEYCFHCKDCFACVGLRRKQYCIFNKQYTKEEYDDLVPRIIGHMEQTGEWGKYFPPTLSPFGYNESLAQEYFPLTEAEARKQGFYWRKMEEHKPKVAKTIPASQLPDAIDDIPDDVLQWAIECAETKRPFRILKQELAFYRNQRLPLPRLHPDVRYNRRLLLRNPRKLWQRTCMKCGKEVQTTYAPERPEIVVCEECYLKEVY